MAEGGSLAEQGIDYSCSVSRTRSEELSMDSLYPIGLVEKCPRDSGSEQKNTHDLGPEGGSTRIPRCNP